MYYGSKISDNITEMPEGYLCCFNVPIGRTGMQQYYGQEIGMEYGVLYEVVRSEEEVFSTTAMASFEGKPFTDEHPPNEVTTKNVDDYLKGVVRNVRRGEGEQSDLLLADILVYNIDVIREIQNGKREISCGYNCLYEMTENGRVKQIDIIGNHVALVRKGRAGDRVAIKDNQPVEGGEKKMEEKKKGIWGRMVQSFAKDATPEEVELMMDEIKNINGETTEEPIVTDEEVKDPLEERMERLEAMMGQILQKLTPKEEVETDALDQLETELKQPEKKEEGLHEEAVTVEPEDVNGEEETVVDHAALLEQIGTLKPIIAQIKDSEQRKKTADTFANVLRQQAGMTTDNSNQEYGMVYQAAMNQAKEKKVAADAAQDERALGRDIAKKYNPHYKEAK